MAELTYIEEKKNYYQSEDFRKNFSGKWVIKELPRPNAELPFFVSESITNNLGGCKFVTTVYVNKAKLFNSIKEAGQYLGEKQVPGFEVFCLKSEDLL
ncbi:hypothetical protein [Rufibacter immobilis]|uniref:hypothetical protein n=1 Tax=Rufibacter immobilis TaxID=1348778 RepID=UPI0035E88FF6